MLQLTSVDANDPDVSRFSANSVPVVNVCVGNVSPLNKNGNGSRVSQQDRDRKCSCLPFDAPLAPDHFSSYWSCPLPWDPAWSTSEVRKEECRRLCWSALNLVASYTSQCALFGREPPEFFLSDPANVCHFSLTNYTRLLT